MVYGWNINAMMAGASRWLMPSTCVACGTQRGTASGIMDLCGPCSASLPVNRCACERCGLPLTGTHVSLTCGACLKRPPLYDMSYCAFEYAYPIEHLIRRCKYGGALPVARVLGRLLADYVSQHHPHPWPQCMVPMPLHAVRYRRRGYNQVLEIGRAVQARLQLPLRTDVVARIRDTPEQAGLTRRARRKNLHRAFAVTSTSVPEHICLLDDVVTTGSSVNAVAATLKRAGARRIEVWSVARATLHAGHQQQ